MRFDQKVLLLLCMGVCFLFYCKNSNLVVTYPAVPTLATSDRYIVTVNGQNVWTEKFQTQMEIEKLPSWFTGVPYTQVQQEVHIANFSGAGRLFVQIQMNKKINHATIRPKSRGIQAEIHDNILKFSLPGPDKLYIEIDDHPPLCFFANPLETEFPDQNDPHVKYFGPGVHEPGLITLKDNDVLYIAGGAIVYGGLRLEENASNVRILGRGILDGGFKYSRMVRLVNGTQIEFNGIIIRNGVNWTNTLINCTDVRYQDVKVISFGPGGDGINPLGSKNVMIQNCFLRCTDDCIAIKAPDSTHMVENVQVLNNTMIGYAFSDGVTIGFETNGPAVRDVLVKNCDILQARGGSRVDGHSAFSIICDGPATISNIHYEDIRVDADVFKLFELHITDGTKYGANPPGHIQKVWFKNISWEPERPIILKGFDAQHLVEDVTFEDCRVAGRRLDSLNKKIFEVNEFVKDVKFR